jgi:hypothetical protein
MAADQVYAVENFPADKRNEVEDALRQLGASPFEDERFPGAVCFHSKKTRVQLMPIVGKLVSPIAHSWKLRGPA